MTERIKTMTYRRAQFTVDGKGPLEAYLVEAHARRPNIENRTIEDEHQMVLECRDFKYKAGVGAFLHIAAYTPGEQASVVPRLRGVASGDIKTVAPPADCEFMDGDTMVLVAGNHGIICSSGLHEKHAERYMCRIIEIAGIELHAEKFSLCKTADVNKVALIRSQGVKSISLNASLYSATLDHIERTTVSKKLRAGIADQVLALLRKDQEQIDLEQAENLNVKLTLSFDRRKNGAAFGREKLESLAKKMVEEDDDGFMIETLSGESVKSDDIILRKKISLPKFGKTVYCGDAWQEMENYYLELKQGGFLEQ